MSGLTDKIAGKAKQVAGVVTEDKRLEGEGKSQDAKGDIKQRVTEILDNAGNAIDDVKKKVDGK